LAVAPSGAATRVRVTRTASRFAGAVLVVGAVVVVVVVVVEVRDGPRSEAAELSSPPEHATSETASTQAPRRRTGRRRIPRG
jgi:hypothetical protein